MTLAERLPELADAELSNLHANAVRLQSVEGRQRDAAAELIPLIEAELTARKDRVKAAAPPRKRATRKAAA